MANKRPRRGDVYRDLSIYGRGGKYGKRIRLVRVLRIYSLHAALEAWWARGPMAGRNPRRAWILVTALQDARRYVRVAEGEVSRG